MKRVSTAFVVLVLVAIFVLIHNNANARGCGYPKTCIPPRPTPATPHKPKPSNNIVIPTVVNAGL